MTTSDRSPEPRPRVVPVSALVTLAVGLIIGLVAGTTIAIVARSDSPEAASAREPEQTVVVDTAFSETDGSEALTGERVRAVDPGDDRWESRPGFPAVEGDPEPIASTGANKLDLIESSGPTTFACLAYLGRGSEEILSPDKERYEQVPDAHLFRARFTDGTTIDIRVHPEVGDADAATAEANRYTTALGQLPHVLRADIGRFAIRNGNETATASYLEGISVQTGNMDVRIADNRMEETLFHEAVHTSLDHEHAYMRSQGWLDAQTADGRFLTEYGRDNPDQEDLAETALYAWALFNHPDRIPTEESAAWQERVPNRIAYLRTLFTEAEAAEPDPVDPCGES